MTTPGRFTGGAEIPQGGAGCKIVEPDRNSREAQIQKEKHHASIPVR